jgi:hypothetical protein
MASSKSSKVETHPLVAALQKDSTQPPKRTVQLFGYPGPAPESESTRLWLSTDLVSYVDVPNSAILHSRKLPDDAGTILWVATDAKLEYGTSSDASAVGNFLSGPIASQHLRNAAIAIAANPTLGGGGFTMGGQCITKVECPSFNPCVTHGCTTDYCPTHTNQCGGITTGACGGASHLVVCNATHAGCATVGGCPSTPDVCYTRYPYHCPSQPPFCRGTVNPICFKE